MFLIDTNIFLEILLEQEKTEECERLIDYIEESNQKFYVSSFTMHSIEVIMTRDNENEALRGFLSDIIKSKITRIETSTIEESKIIGIVNNSGLDFDDALQYFVCKNNGLTIISFDRHFDKMHIKRLEPKEIIQKYKGG